MKKNTSDSKMLVKDYSYGEAKATNTREKEKSRMAKLEYSDAGELISSDFSLLDEYIENEFIPNHIKYKKSKPEENLEDDLLPYIRLGDLIHLNLSEAEIEHAMNYLSDLNIDVNGRSFEFEDDFDNYNYKSKYKMIFPQVLPKEKQKKMFGEYKKTKDKTLKNELVEGNMRLVPDFCKKYARITGIDIEELNSYGYEGLIEAIDSYDLSRGEFSTHARVYIKRRVFEGIKEISGFKKDNFYERFNKIRVEIEKKYDEKLIDNLDLAEEIAKELLKERKRKNGNYSVLLHKTKRKILIKYPENIDDYTEDERLIDDNTLYYQTIEKIAFNDMKDKLNEALECLSYRERKIIEERFGFFDGKLKKFVELAKKYDFTKERVRQIQVSGLEKLRKLPEIKELIEMNLGEYSFDPNGINDIPNDNLEEKGKIKIKR